MSGIPFEQTRQGQMFYNGQLPRLINGIEKLTEVIEKQNQLLEAQQKELDKIKEHLNIKDEPIEEQER